MQPKRIWKSGSVNIWPCVHNKLANSSWNLVSKRSITAVTWSFQNGLLRLALKATLNIQKNVVEKHFFVLKYPVSFEKVLARSCNGTVKGGVYLRHWRISTG